MIANNNLFKSLYFVFLNTLILSLNSCESESINRIPVTNNTNPIQVEEDTSNFSAEAIVLLELVNQERVSRNLNPLILSSALSNAATNHSIDMETNIGSLNHTGSDGSSFIERSERSNYSGFSRAENIARGHITPEQVHEAWMNSAGHRSNILLSDITDMGIGKSQNNFWTQVFGRN